MPNLLWAPPPQPPDYSVLEALLRQHVGNNPDRLGGWFWRPLLEGWIQGVWQQWQLLALSELEGLTADDQWPNVGQRYHYREVCVCVCVCNRRSARFGSCPWKAPNR